MRCCVPGASGPSRRPTAAATCRHHAEAPATASSSSSSFSPPPSSPPLPPPPPPLRSLSRFEPERRSTSGLLRCRRQREMTATARPSQRRRSITACVPRNVSPTCDALSLPPAPAGAPGGDQGADARRSRAKGVVRPRQHLSRPVVPAHALARAFPDNRFRPARHPPRILACPATLRADRSRPHSASIRAIHTVYRLRRPLTARLPAPRRTPPSPPSAQQGIAAADSTPRSPIGRPGIAAALSAAASRRALPRMLRRPSPPAGPGDADERGERRADAPSRRGRDALPSTGADVASLAYQVAHMLRQRTRGRTRYLRSRGCVRALASAPLCVPSPSPVWRVR